MGQTDELVLIKLIIKRTLSFVFTRDRSAAYTAKNSKSGAGTSKKLRLGWFAAFYRDALSFVRDDDYAAIRDLLASPTGECI